MAREPKGTAAQDSGLRQRLFAALTGSNGDVSGQGQNLRGMLEAIGGKSSKTRSGIDLSTAAARLKVSRRTVERWVKADETGLGQRPKPQSMKALQRMSRQAASTKAGRARAAREVAKRMSSAGSRLTITGDQGPPDGRVRYKRVRTTILEIGPDDATSMLDAWVQGGEKGFLGWAEQYWDENYVDEWEFDSIDTIDVRSEMGGEWR